MNGDEYERWCDECGKCFRVESEDGREYDYDGYIMCPEHRVENPNSE